MGQIGEIDSGCAGKVRGDQMYVSYRRLRCKSPAMVVECLDNESMSRIAIEGWMGVKRGEMDSCR